jgi:hypothetical protein
MRQILGTHSNNKFKISQNGGIALPHIDTNDSNIKSSKLNQITNIPLHLIKEAKSASKEKNETMCIFSISDKKLFLNPNKAEKREIYIDSLLNEDLFIETSDILKSYPSIRTFYDTETDSTDILTRHQIVIDFLYSIGFKRSFFQFGDFEDLDIGGDNIYFNIEDSTKIETSYTSVYAPGTIVKVQPNLSVKINSLDNDRSIEYTFFFDRSRIINEISKTMSTENSKSWKREQIIGKILNIN